MTGSVCGTCHLNGMKNPSDCLRDQFFNSMVKLTAWLSAFNHSLRLKPALIVVISHPLLTITAADLEQNPSPPCGFHPSAYSSDSKKRNIDPSYLIKAKKKKTLTEILFCTQLYHPTINSRAPTFTSLSVTSQKLPFIMDHSLQFLRPAAFRHTVL